MSKNLGPVTRDHSVWFGAIINIFAKIEMQMHIAVAGMIGTDLGTAMILMSGAQYRNRRRIVKNINVTVGLNGHQIDDLNTLMDELHKLSNLRNWIAHATWVEGRRTGSIKPMLMLLSDDDEPNLKGHHHNERDWTVEDLKSEAKKLDVVDRKLHALLVSTGIVDRVQAKIDERSRSTSARPGKPSSR